MDKERVECFVSYIVPCYNIQNYLPRCLDSLSSQKIVDGLSVEFVLVNDGSTDSTLSLLREFEKKESRAVIIDQENQGVSAARNNGLIVAKGKYVFFLDGDDFLTDDATQIIYDVCKDNKPDIVITNACIIKEGQWDNETEWNPCNGITAGMYKTLEFAQLAKELPISFKFYRREMLTMHNIKYDKELRVGEVFAFFLHAMTISNYILYTDKRIMNYVERKSSVMRTVDIERDFTIIKTIHLIDVYAREYMPELLELPSYKLSLFRIVNMFGMFNYVNKSSYTTEIGELLVAINKDNIYRELQKYCLYKEAGINKKTLYRILLYFFPVSFSYRLFRFFKIIKSFI